VPDVETILVAVGGGLITGIAAWYASRIEIVGVEPSAAPPSRGRWRLLEALQGGIATSLTKEIVP
jgi:threonine dehydratase